MLGVALLFLTVLFIPEFPVLSALALSGAAYAARGWTAAGEDVVAMVFFYGALAGCLTVWLS